MIVSTSTEASPHDRVQSAIRNAATTTGASFDYLLSTARRESALDPQARATTSSATGLFQFVDSTWMQMVKVAGPGLGLSSYADAIVQSDRGTYAAKDEASRQAILALRNNPEVNALLAGAFTQMNRQTLQNSLGRDPTEGELYVAHFLGAAGATSLIRLAAKDGSALAADAFPRQAATNRSVFYDRTGQALPVSDVYARLVASARSPATVAPVSSNGAQADEPDKIPANPAVWLAIPAHNAYAIEAATPAGRLSRTSLFSPVSNPVAAIWSGIPIAAADRSKPVTPAATSVLQPDMAAVPVSGDPVQPAEAPTQSGIGWFFSSLFATSQASPLRDGKSWGR